MALQIRIVAGARVPGGRAFVLCDDAGRMLPGQTAIVVEQDDEGRSIVTVSFEINGVDVAIDGREAVEEE